MRYGMMEVLARELPDAVGVDVAADLVRGQLAVKLEREVYAHKLASWDSTHEEPASWFQHLKRTLGLKHRSVVRSAHITRYRTYPNATIILPPRGDWGISVLREESTSILHEERT